MAIGLLLGMRRLLPSGSSFMQPSPRPAPNSNSKQPTGNQVMTVLSMQRTPESLRDLAGGGQTMGGVVDVGDDRRRRRPGGHHLGQLRGG